MVSVERLRQYSDIAQEAVNAFDRLPNLPSKMTSTPEGAAATAAELSAGGRGGGGGGGGGGGRWRGQLTIKG